MGDANVRQRRYPANSHLSGAPTAWGKAVIRNQRQRDRLGRGRGRAMIWTRSLFHRVSPPTCTPVYSLLVTRLWESCVWKYLRPS